MNLHCMIDFETLGHNAPHVAVLSLGAVMFTRGGKISGAEWIFNMPEQIQKKRSVTAETISWWFNQGAEAKAVIQKASTSGTLMGQVMAEFNDVIGKAAIEVKAKPDKVIIWSCGAGFDVPIAESLYMHTQTQVPWKFWNIRCYRTIKSVHEIEAGVKREGVKHSALADAEYQAECVMKWLTANPGLDR